MDRLKFESLQCFLKMTIENTTTWDAILSLARQNAYLIFSKNNLFLARSFGSSRPNPLALSLWNLLASRKHNHNSRKAKNPINSNFNDSNWTTGNHTNIIKMNSFGLVQLLLALFGAVLVLSVVQAANVCPDAKNMDDCVTCCFSKKYYGANYDEECWCDAWAGLSIGILTLKRKCFGLNNEADQKFWVFILRQWIKNKLLRIVNLSSINSSRGTMNIYAG